MRILQVEKCEYCPYRHVDAFVNGDLLECRAFNKPQRISNRVKTFPLFCPLDKV